MAKGNPLRLDARLMREARASGELMHRSDAEQIEYWADLGRRVEGMLGPQDLLDVKAGLARLQVQPADTRPVDPAAVFAQVEARRDEVAQALGSSVQYRASRTHPGLLDAVYPDGTVKVGQFRNGKFVAHDRAA